VKTLGRLSGLRNMVAFLTVVPVGKTSGGIDEFTGVWFLSPVVGAFIGAVAGLVALTLLRVLPILVVGALAVGVIILITGAHHLDGLLDFGDALMVHGSPERKVEVMHDKSLGAGGFALGLFVTILTIVSVVTLTPNFMVQGLIVSETSAKLSMVAASRFGKTSHEGTGLVVVKAMHERYGNIRLLAAFIISMVIGGIIAGYVGLLAVSSSIICALLMTAIADKQFRGITGDVFGAANEISRMVSLLTLVAVIK
jgi:adenosylcobinamide-GDP ribazoletransferase